MKYLNYLPNEIKDRRLKARLIKVAVLLIVITGLYTGYLTAAVTGLRGDIEEQKKQVLLVNSVERSIQDEKDKLTKNTQLVNAIGVNPLPLNLFLGTLLAKTPKDIVIYDILTGDVSGPVVDVSTAEGEKEEVTTEDEETEEKKKGDTEEHKKGTDGEDEVKASEPPTGAVYAGGETYGNIETVLLRGASFSLQSISLLVTSLENEPYIRGVKLSPIENYDDGYFNHRIFQLVIELEGGGTDNDETQYTGTGLK